MRNQLVDLLVQVNGAVSQQLTPVHLGAGSCYDPLSHGTQDQGPTVPCWIGEKLHQAFLLLLFPALFDY